MLPTTLLLITLAAAITTATPVHPRNGLDCTSADWHFTDNVADAAGTGAQTDHPMWGKKFATKCECASAVQSTSYFPLTVLLAYDATSATCYPLGVSGSGSTVSLALTNPLGDSAPGWPTASIVGSSNPPSAKNCVHVTMGNGGDQSRSACLAMTAARSDFVTFDEDSNVCNICHWDAVAGHSVGVFTLAVTANV